MRTLWADLRYGARLMLKSPGFTVVALLTLGLGIGANTAIFSVLDAVLLQPLPFAHPEELAMVWEDASFVSFPKNTPAPANFADWKKRNRSFVDMAALRYATANLTEEGSPEFVFGNNTTANFFSVLGVAPMRGRTFTADEDREDRKVVILSYGLWQRRYGGDASVVGRTIRMSGDPYTVIGIMPRGFHFPQKRIDFWRPLGFAEKQYGNRGQHFLNVLARLKPGVTREQAQDDMSSIAAQLEKEYPDSNRQIGAVVVPLREEMVGDTRVVLWMLLGASLAVLLIGCANLANLLLARGSIRSREMALRSALGAGRGRLLMQLLTESLLLSAAGGLLGLLLALAGLRLLDHLVPASMMSFTEIGLNVRLLLFTIGVSVATGVVFGLAPAWQAARRELIESLKQGGRADAGSAGQGFRYGLVVCEVAMAVVLVAGAGLLIESLINLHRVDLGFRSDRLLTAVTALPQTKYPKVEQRIAFYDRVIAEVRRLPGVEAAAFGSNLPFSSIGNTNGYEVEGQQPQAGMDALYRSGTPTYLQTLQVRLKQGRLLDERDIKGALDVVVVNETFVRRHFPNGDAVGKRVRYGRNNPWMTIAGVVEDVKERGLQLEMKPATYVPLAQQNGQTNSLVVRASVDPLTLANAIRKVIWEVDKEQPIFAVRTMEQIVEEQLASRSQHTRLLILFAALALLLAGVGLYGVLSYAVAQRRREIGLRIALGASPMGVLRMILRRGMGMTGIGLVAGIAAALLCGQFVQTLLFGVKTTSPVPLAVTAAVLAVVALAACTVPARRAATVDPMTALRED